MTSLIPLLGAATAGALWLVGHWRIVHIRRHYPDEWEKAGYNPAKMRHMRRLNLEQSLQYGALSKTHDTKLQHYRRLERVVTLAGGGAMVMLFISALL